MTSRPRAARFAVRGRLLVLAAGLVLAAAARVTAQPVSPTPAGPGQPAPAAGPATGGAWLDATPPLRWNVQGSAVPKPPSVEGEPLATGRCAAQVRPPRPRGIARSPRQDG